MRGADHAWVDIRRSAGDVVVSVRDDGLGGADIAAGTGLRGLADRLSALEGELRVVSPPGNGTRVEARIPCLRAEPVDGPDDAGSGAPPDASPHPGVEVPR